MTLDDVVQGVLTLKDKNQKRLLRALETHYNPKEGDNMTTNKKTSKKAPRKRVSKATAKKKAPAKRKAAKKTVAKKAPRKQRPAKKAAKGRTDGLRAGSVQAKFVDLAKRKTGVTLDEAVTRLQSTPGSVRVMVNLLKKKGFAITKPKKAYVIAK